jgi:cytochrome c peroxidase
LPLNAFLNDNGRVEVTLNEKDSMKFKVPSLRNLSFSFPYMHDGRFTKLNEVLNHYTDSTVQAQFLKSINKSPIYLSGDEKVDLIAFLLTLNDKEFVFNPKHRFPKELLTKTKE